MSCSSATTTADQEIDINTVPIPTLDRSQSAIPPSELGAQAGGSLPITQLTAPVSIPAFDAIYDGHILVTIPAGNAQTLEVLVSGMENKCTREGTRNGWVYVYDFGEGQRAIDAQNGLIPPEEVFPQENFFLFGGERTGPFGYLHNPGLSITATEALIYLQAQNNGILSIDRVDTDDDGDNDTHEVALGTDPEENECNGPIIPTLPNPDNTDVDDDGIPNGDDNCFSVPNPDQLDLDGDDKGDACDADLDGDGVPQVTTLEEIQQGSISQLDNCPLVPNPNQLDENANARGDACEGDYDGDGVSDEDDNCVTVRNADQADGNNDGVGDVCS